MNAAWCGNESTTTAYTDDPDQVAGCEDCLELVSEDLEDHNDYRGRCLHCRQEITAQGGVEWWRVVRRPCPHCGKPGQGDCKVAENPLVVSLSNQERIMITRPSTSSG